MLQLKGNSRSLDLEGYTVVIPSICVGNAAQLGLDLLISSLKLSRIGSLSHISLIPVYGPSAFQHEPNEKVAAVEIYESKEMKLCALQFRSPLISRHAKDFHNQLAKLFKDAKVKRVIVLSGSFGFEKRIIGKVPYEYKASNAFKNLHEKELEKVEWTEFGGEIIYGGGNGLQLYKVFEEAGLPVMLLFRYLLEGDNCLDAQLIIKELSELCSGFLKISFGDGDNSSIKLQVPVSWKLLFGNDVGELIF